MMCDNLLILGASSEVAAALIPEVSNKVQKIYAHYYQSGERLRSIQKEVSCEMELLQADFTDEEDTKALIRKVAESGANITHILHCPSARIENRRFQKLGWEEYAQMLYTQLRSLYYAAAQFVPQMTKQRRGKIVSILSSCTVGTPPPYLNAYVTAKYAQLGFIRSLAAELADKSIQINAVSPGMMETRFVSGMSHLVVEKSASEHPLNRNATVGDVVPVVKFLLSEQSDFITGQNILVSGGSLI